jgi:ABC-2 type transport system ATP-binding protein
METAIRTRDLTKCYGDQFALDTLDLEVPAGSVFGFLGPNGSGKTTTIRLLAGLLRPTRGTAEILGIDATRYPDRVHRRIGYLPGEFAAYADLTAERYLRYLADLRGDVPWRNVDHLARRLDLRLDRRIGALSHGNRQKIGIVQAFMVDAPVLLLDEPTAGLDPLMQREFLTLVAETRAAGRTVFLSSHILSEVEAVADRIGILRGGRLIAVDTVDHLRARAVRRLDLTFAEEPPASALTEVPGIRDLAATDSTVHLVVEGSTAPLFAALAPYHVEDVVSHEPDLEEIFLALYDGGER